MTDTILAVDFRRVRVQMNKLKQLASPTVQRQLLARLVERVAVAGQSLVSDPPIPTRAPLPKKYKRTAADGSTYMSKFKTRKQQGYFFAVVVKNKQTPYKRGRGKSEQLTATLGLLPYSITNNNKKWVITWGLDQSYAQLVVGDEEQQADYHKGVWTPLSDDIMSDDAVKTYGRVFTDGLTKSIEGLSRADRSAFTL